MGPWKFSVTHGKAHRIFLRGTSNWSRARQKVRILSEKVLTGPTEIGKARKARKICRKGSADHGGPTPCGSLFGLGAGRRGGEGATQKATAGPIMQLRPEQDTNIQQPTFSLTHQGPNNKIPEPRNGGADPLISGRGDYRSLRIGTEQKMHWLKAKLYGAYPNPMMNESGWGGWFC
jgi:hypothetical protein